MWSEDFCRNELLCETNVNWPIDLKNPLDVVQLSTEHIFIFCSFLAKPIRPGQQMGLRAMAQNGPVPIRGGGGAANNA